MTTWRDVVRIPVRGCVHVESPVVRRVFRDGTIHYGEQCASCGRWVSRPATTDERAAAKPYDAELDGKRGRLP